MLVSKKKCEFASSFLWKSLILKKLMQYYYALPTSLHGEGLKIAIQLGAASLYGKTLNS